MGGRSRRGSLRSECDGRSIGCRKPDPNLVLPARPPGKPVRSRQGQAVRRFPRHERAGTENGLFTRGSKLKRMTCSYPRVCCTVR